ncbi:annexin A7 isoform X1 [Tribolium castaneum]|uniref:Uncharacterized protein n=1 Tax=Tribolium castaneum TaxID=7070 RepID=D6WUK6_TRICA|nr:PREDICTED: annexin A7 isoform X1 [Tribolium castaneum]XP_008196165.1 PREDICTED: annexin A7 isoform X1 [Tribolium castaneum]XP_008196166.1 PREDICTED: annexin A7 isoform X1 [Tribolium castaneum]XP_015837931.1 PREDICTED: annexin A7 isoform X1 [Tribolium castaneum]EFA08486.2 hypothetical protein TcasGA2_TC006138 [Tribolium castaneum]|eukprot:XP_008196164.1 PREDICTED: annexin A7 isoform X1 [Tribolium castaneum]
MKSWLVCAFMLACLELGESYSKYGRTCKDIGCLTNEVCVMETDPCSYYQRQNECGSYPTCKKMDNAGPPTCKSYVCPPTKVCRMDGATPKCVDDHSKVGRVGYDTTELKSADQPSGNIYPNLPRGETTPRPNIGYQGPPGQGYQGGQIGSGYPGQAKPYPQGYPQQTYPQQPYPGYNGYNNQQGGYRGGYPQQNGYPNYNYNGQYPNNYQGGYNPYGQNRYGQNSGASSGGFVDSLTSALKKYGTNLLKDAITKQIAGGNNRN